MHNFCLQEAECALCLSAVPAIVFLPCQHFCCCVACARDVRKSGRGKPGLCPMCRAEIKEELTISGA